MVFIGYCVRGKSGPFNYYCIITTTTTTTTTVLVFRKHNPGAQVTLLYLICYNLSFTSKEEYGDMHSDYLCHNRVDNIKNNNSDLDLGSHL